MKKRTILAFALLIVGFSKLCAQNEYRNDHVIVYFRDDVLNEDLLKQNGRSFGKDELVKQQTLKDSLDRWNVGIRFQKLVRNARPDKNISISRTGQNVNIPKFYNLMLLKVSPSTNIPELCRKLEELPYVLHAEPDYLMKTNDVPAPNDTHFNQQDGWEQTSDVDIDLLRAWDFTRGSTAIKVGIVDSGIDYHNPDLGNGSFGAGFKVAGGYDYFSDDSNPDDSSTGSHGTNVSGIVAAQGNNGSGVTGVAGGDASTGNLGVVLIALRVGESTVSVSNAVEAIYDAATSVNQGGYGCHLINYSAGDYTVSDISRKAISYAVQNGVIFVAGKGNDNTTNPHYPSDYNDNLIISVGASDNFDFKWDHSNFGNNIDVIAPGTADLLFTTARVEEGSYTSMEGTSGAAPVVTGLSALLKSINPNLHRDDVERIIEISADDVNPELYNYINGYEERVGHGRVNAGRALEFLHIPWTLTHHTTSGSGATWQNLSGDGEGLIFNNDASTIPLAAGWYYGQKYEVTKTVNKPQSDCEHYVWTRNVNATQGWSAANPNSNLGYGHIIRDSNYRYISYLRLLH